MNIHLIDLRTSLDLTNCSLQIKTREYLKGAHINPQDL
jgi:hypothetical protein